MIGNLCSNQTAESDSDPRTAHFRRGRGTTCFGILKFIWTSLLLKLHRIITGLFLNTFLKDIRLKSSWERMLFSLESLLKPWLQQFKRCSLKTAEFCTKPLPFNHPESISCCSPQWYSPLHHTGLKEISSKCIYQLEWIRQTEWQLHAQSQAITHTADHSDCFSKSDLSSVFCFDRVQCVFCVWISWNICIVLYVSHSCLLRHRPCWAHLLLLSSDFHWICSTCHSWYTHGLLAVNWHKSASDHFSHQPNFTPHHAPHGRLPLSCKVYAKFELHNMMSQSISKTGVKPML